jgi:hypothetical protein
VPPRGYCIDKRSLKQNFALMARCDTLGVPSAAGDAPLGIITISLAPIAPDTPLPSAEKIMSEFRLRPAGDSVQTENAVIFRAAGKPVLAGTASAQWRGAARIGNQLLGLALYGPEGGRAIGADGRAALQALVANSRAGIPKRAVSKKATDDKS